MAASDCDPRSTGPFAAPPPLPTARDTRRGGFSAPPPTGSEPDLMRRLINDGRKRRQTHIRRAGFVAVAIALLLIVGFVLYS